MIPEQQLITSNNINSNTHSIDQNALSRQLATYGAQTQARLMKMNVFIHGLSGIGIQVAKNLILAGPKSVTIYDQNIVTHQDPPRNFYIKSTQISQITRSQACLQQLKQLNPNCSISISKDNSVQNISKNYNCVVILDNYDKQYLIQLNKKCRQKNVGFILAGVLGLYGYTFVDFGQKHLVFDTNGQQPKTIFIAGITQQQKAIVYLHQKSKHGLNDGDYVQFKQVQGMTEINGKKFKIQAKTPSSFSIGDTTKFSPYQNGGIALQVKVPVQMQFNSFQKSLRNPYAPDSKQMPIASWEKFGVSQKLHIILNGVYDFWNKKKHLPEAINNQHAEQLIKLVKQRQSNLMQIQGQQFKVQNIDQNLIKNVALYAQTQISPVCSFWGGIITQQIVKLTGKYSPLRQWFHHQFFQILNQNNSLTKRTLNPTQKYNDYVILFGDQFVKRAHNSNSFMIGAGALGCQFIKMFSLMGLGTNENGKITVTDDDNIEISNLNRQFLFRKQHVGKNKCQTACNAGLKINQQVKFNALKMKITPQNEDYFNDDFWTSLDFVVNAVDNVSARKYVDNQCVWYEKPLFESGTLGTKCHSQIIIPHQTISYNDIIDPPEQQFALCTLKIFPYQIQHTIQWARQYFEGVFAQPSAQLQKFYSNKELYLNQTEKLLKRDRNSVSSVYKKLEDIKKFQKINENKQYSECIQMGVDIFQYCFNYQIQKLLNLFPVDHIDSQTKKPYWSGLKRAPKVIKLNIDDPLHLQLVQSAANIFATILNIPIQKDKQIIKKLIVKSNLNTEFNNDKIKIQNQNKNDSKTQQNTFTPDQEQKCYKLIEQLKQIQVNPKNSPVAIQFQKDDSTNWHIQFMGAVANLRARNYSIEEVENFKIKLIAGKIIPAIATTTATIVGAVGIQIIKFLLNKPLSIFKNVTINLALPLFVFNDPIQPIVFKDKKHDQTLNGPVKVVPKDFTKWNKINVKGPMKLLQLKYYLQNFYKIDISFITFQTSAVYTPFGVQAKKRLEMKVEQAIQSVIKKQLPKWKKYIPLGISANLLDGTDCIMPVVKYQIY